MESSFMHLITLAVLYIYLVEAYLKGLLNFFTNCNTARHKVLNLFIIRLICLFKTAAGSQQVIGCRS